MQNNWSRRKLTVEEFILRSNKKYNSYYDYSLVEYKKANEKVKIICPKHGIFEQTPAGHKNFGCQKCSLSRAHESTRFNIDVFIEKANNVHGGFYDYSHVEYKNNKTEIFIICPIHNGFYQVPAEHLRGKGCPCCKSSKGETIIDNFLKNNNIKFLRQYKFDECKGKKYKLPFDFFLPDYNIAIEYDGSQHFFGWNYDKESLKGIQERDLIKTEYCIKNGINLIRISYQDDVYEKLSFLLS